MNFSRQNDNNSAIRFHGKKIALYFFVADYRATFHKDVVVDLVGYRKHGHNEIDEPMFTQPIMYGIIKKHKNVLDIYAKKLVDEGCVTQEEVDQVIEKYDKICEEAYKKAASEKQVHMLFCDYSLL